MAEILTAILALVLFSVPVSAAKLHVGPDKTFKTLGAAVKASQANDTILIDSGTYENDFSVIRRPITIKSVGGKARLNASGLIPNGKAILVANANLAIEGLIFSNARVADRNGAGIRHQKGALAVQNCFFEGNENGILTSSDPNGSVVIQNSRFIGNGHGGGYSHGIYIGKIGSLTVRNSFFAGTKVGHHIKSRAQTTTISETTLDDGDAASSYAIDLPNGGTNVVRGNTFIQRMNPENDIIISIGTKTLHGSSSLVVEGNQFLNFASRGTAIRNAMSEPVLIRANSFFGPLVIVRGPAKQDDNVVFADVPERVEGLDMLDEAGTP